MIYFLQSYAGIYLYIRNSEDLRNKNLLEIKTLIKLGLIFLLINTLLLSFFPFSFLLFCVCCHTPHLSLIALEKWLRFWREKQFYIQFLPFLNEVLLHMRSGKAFRSAINITNQRKHKVFKQRISDIMEILIYSEDSNSSLASPFVTRILYEFKKADLQPHNSLKRLIHFKTKLKREDNFNKQSKRVLSHIRLQSLLLTLLYSFLLLFTFLRYGFKSNAKIIFVSFLIFSSGIALFFLIGQKFKWKV